MKEKKLNVLKQIKGILDSLNVTLAEEKPEEAVETKPEAEKPEAVETNYVTHEELSAYAKKSDLTEVFAELTAAVESLRDITEDKKGDVPVEASEEKPEEEKPEAEKSLEVELAEETKEAEKVEDEIVHSPEAEVETKVKWKIPKGAMSTGDAVREMLWG